MSGILKSTGVCAGCGVDLAPDRNPAQKRCRACSIVREREMVNLRKKRAWAEMNRQLNEIPFIDALKPVAKRSEVARLMQVGVPTLKGIECAALIKLTKSLRRGHAGERIDAYVEVLRECFEDGEWIDPADRAAFVRELDDILRDCHAGVQAAWRTA